jgi:tetratricopeptide (TPR) repeat protein
LSGNNIANRSDNIVNRGSNTFNRNNINNLNVAANRQVNQGRFGVDPGFGVRPPAYNNWRGPYWNNHQSWVNGYWHGYHNGTNWNWGSFALGATASVAAWGLGSAIYSWGYMPYSNPYYASAAPVVVQQPVVVDAGQSAAPAYDYSQPINTQVPPPEASVTDTALATFGSARQTFQSGEYSQALQLTDQALAQLPNDATLHEFRALCLFALQKYEQAAAPLYAVLSVGPGWDWTTLAGLYPSIDVYTQQLRALEAFTRSNPKSAAGHFVLAYHYLTQGHIDAAVGELKQVVALSPQDKLSAQLISQFSAPKQEGGSQSAPPSAPPGAAPAKPGKLAGNWKANPDQNTSINLSMEDNGPFTWKVTTKGKAQEIKGDWSLTGDVLTLAQTGQGGGAMVGNVTWPAGNQFVFRIMGAGAGDSGLSFTQN